MTETRELTIYEKAFAKSDKTDATLVVQGKKFHVNKALLSYHSDYFNSLFNSEFKEKSMEEIEIKDVKYKVFATLLSLVQENPMVPTERNAERILELADQFLLAAAKRHVELFLATTTKIDKLEKLRIADKYNLELLLKHAVSLYNKEEDFRNIYDSTKDFSDKTKAKLYGRFMKHF